MIFLQQHMPNVMLSEIVYAIVVYAKIDMLRIFCVII